MRTMLGTAGALVVAVSAAYYFADVLRGRTRPHQASWLVWAVIGVLGFGTADDGGAGPGAYAAAVDALAAVATFALSLAPRYGKPGLRRSDVVLGVTALAAVVLWRWGPLSTGWAAVLAVSCDAVALWPTVREGWLRPELESRTSWTADVLGNGLCLCAVGTASVAALAYPIYLLAACAAMTVILFRPRPARVSADQRPASARSSPTTPSPLTPPARRSTPTQATHRPVAACAASSARTSASAGAHAARTVDASASP
jgi:hypothetical protein